MRIVHFADLHLDSAFAWSGATGDVARRRRQALRDTLLSIAKLVRETNAEALFCAGDLYEHDRVTPDTAEFLKKTFRDLDPVPVYVSPGNHDYYALIASTPPPSGAATSTFSANLAYGLSPSQTDSRSGVLPTALPQILATYSAASGRKAWVST